MRCARAALALACLVGCRAGEVAVSKPVPADDTSAPEGTARDEGAGDAVGDGGSDDGGTGGGEEGAGAGGPGGGTGDDAGSGGDDTGSGSDDAGSGGDDAGSGGDTGEPPLDPCAVVLPADTVVYRDPATVTEPGTWALVCRNATASFSGSAVRAAVRRGGAAVFTGGEPMAWVEDRGSVVVLGGSGAIGAVDPGDVTDAAGAATVTECPSLTIDTSAVTDPC